MVKRIDRLTPEQQARMSEWAHMWIKRGLCTDSADWERFEDGARRCYEFAGVRWHGNVVRVSSPLVLSLAAPVAAGVIESRGAVGGAVDGAVGGAVDGAVHGAVDGAVRGAVVGAVDDAVGGAVRGAVVGAVRGAVDGAVRDAVRDAVDDAVDDAVRGAVVGAVGGAVDGAVGGAVRGAVDGAVDGAVRGAVDDVRNRVLRYWYYRLGGQWWLNWQAWTSFFRDVCNLELDGDLWDRDRAYADAQSSAGWWWPHREFVMVCDRPAEVHTEQIRPSGWGSHRLHREDGPAIRWRDGYALYYWHGVRVPADLIEKGWGVEEIFAERNAEVRRCAIEKYGWDNLTERMELVASAPDPGNAPYYLALYDLPGELSDMYEADARILLCVNGTVEPGGERRRFGLPVPGHHTDPVEAAAELYGWPVEAYRQLEVRR